MALPPPPTDLDRLASAWQALRDLVNTQLPALVSRILAVRGKINGTSLPPGPRPL